jgi:hypothetical protein
MLLALAISGPRLAQSPPSADPPPTLRLDDDFAYTAHPEGSRREPPPVGIGQAQAPPAQLPSQASVDTQIQPLIDTARPAIN